MGRWQRRAGRWPRPMPAFALELDSWPGLEAQVAAIADDIAYDNHDIDDGLRAGILDLDELLERAAGRAAVGGDRGAPPRARPRRARSRRWSATGSARWSATCSTRPGGASPRRGWRRSTRCAPAGAQLAGFSAAMQAEERGAQALPLRQALQQRRADPGAGRGAAGHRRPRRRLSRRPGAAARRLAARRGRNRRGCAASPTSSPA